MSLYDSYQDKRKCWVQKHYICSLKLHGYTSKDSGVWLNLCAQYTKIKVFIYIIWNHKTAVKISQKQSTLYFFVCLAFWFDIWHNLWRKRVNKTFLKLERDFAWDEVRTGRSGQFLLNQSSFPSFTEIQFLKLLPSRLAHFCSSADERELRVPKDFHSVG